MSPSALATLIQENARLLQQACAVLRRADEQIWTKTPPSGTPHRAGPQFRHVIEFYECLLDGVAAGRVDYDGRRRDIPIETSMQFAIARMERLCDRLVNDPMLLDERELMVRMEDAPAETDAWFLSSVGRELQSVRTHTVHHFALIAITLQAWGLEVDSDFGVAPSTLRFRNSASNSEREAA